MAKQGSKNMGAALREMRDQRLSTSADPAEQTRRVLVGHEHVIENARRSFVDMGRSLLAIRTERLYADEYPTFAEYCDARWDISEAYANRVINAALVAIKSTPIGVEINSEAQARELSDLVDEPEQLRQVWDEATRRAAGGRVTAALIKEVRRALDPPPADPLETIPDEAKDAIAAKLAEQSAPVDQPTPPDAASETDDTSTGVEGEQGQPESDHSASAAPSEAAEDAPRDDGSAGGSADSPESAETGSEGDAPQRPSDPVDGRGQQDLGGVSEPAAPGPVQLLEELAEKYEQLDVDVLGPLMTSAEMTALGDALDRVVVVVELLTKWNERAQP